MRGGAAGSLCGHRAGERLAEASGAEEEGGRRPQTGPAGAGGGLLPRDKLYLQLLLGALQQEGAGERLPPEATLHPLSPRPRGIITSQSPHRTSVSGSSTFTEGRPTAGEKPQLPLHHGRVNKNVQEGTSLSHAQPEHSARQGPKHVSLGTMGQATSWSGTASNATSLEYFRATQEESQLYKARTL